MFVFESRAFMIRKCELLICCCSRQNLNLGLDLHIVLWATQLNQVVRLGKDN